MGPLLAVPLPLLTLVREQQQPWRSRVIDEKQEEGMMVRLAD